MPKILQIEERPERKIGRVTGKIFDHKSSENETGLDFFDVDEEKPSIEVGEFNATEIHGKTGRILGKINRVLKSDVQEMEVTIQLPSPHEPTECEDPDLECTGEGSAFDFKATLEDKSKVKISAFFTVEVDGQFSEGQKTFEDGSTEEMEEGEAGVTINIIDELREAIEIVLDVGLGVKGLSITGIQIKTQPSWKTKFRLDEQNEIAE